MIQLRPTEQFTIVRVLGDTQDSSTYYVQAVIRDSKDDSIIDTVNLTDQGSRRFTGLYEIPADVSGEGFYIDITTTVYTDSSYSVNAPDYAEESETYLVQDRYNRTFGLGGGGVDIDYKKLRNIVKEEVNNRILPKQKILNLSKIEEGIIEAIKRIDDIKFPEQKETDLSGVLSGIQKAIKAIDDKRIPEPEKLDLTPAIETSNNNSRMMLTEILNAIKTLSDLVREDLSASTKGNSELIDKNGKELIKKMADLFIDKTPTLKVMMPEVDKEEKIKEKPKKIRNFMNR